MVTTVVLEDSVGEKLDPVLMTVLCELELGQVGTSEDDDAVLDGGSVEYLGVVRTVVDAGNYSTMVVYIYSTKKQYIIQEYK